MALCRVRLTLEMYVEADDETQAVELAQNDLPEYQPDLVDWSARQVRSRISVREQPTPTRKEA